MADVVLGIVAQKLLKKLCPHCKEVRPLSDEDRALLAAFYRRELPQKTAHPVGCVRCGHSGYMGREGVYEVIEFDGDIAALVRAGKPIAEIRDFAKKRGDYLISDHAMDKVRAQIFSFREVYEKVLAEEPELNEGKKEPNRVPAGVSKVLIVEDDPDSAALIERFLKGAGIEADKSTDGIEALLALGRERYDLILSDVEMPNLDGFKLVEMKKQKGIDTPVLFLTGRTSPEDEARGLELGAVDYIRKPIEKGVLLLRVKNALSRGAA